MGRRIPRGVHSNGNSKKSSIVSCYRRRRWNSGLPDFVGIERRTGWRNAEGDGIVTTTCIGKFFCRHHKNRFGKYNKRSTGNHIGRRIWHWRCDPTADGKNRICSPRLAELGNFCGLPDKFAGYRTHAMTFETEKNGQYSHHQTKEGEE